MKNPFLELEHQAAELRHKDALDKRREVAQVEVAFGETLDTERVGGDRWAEADRLYGDGQSSAKAQTTEEQETREEETAYVDDTEPMALPDMPAEPETPLINPLSSSSQSQTVVDEQGQETVHESRHEGRLGSERVTPGSLAESELQARSKLDLATLLQTSVAAQMALAALVMLPIYVVVSGDGPEHVAPKEMVAQPPSFPSLELKPRATGVGSAQRVEEQMAALQRRSTTKTKPAESSPQTKASLVEHQEAISLTQEELELLLAQAKAEARHQRGPQGVSGSRNAATRSTKTSKPVLLAQRPEPVGERGSAGMPVRRRLGRFFESGGQLGAEEGDRTQGQGRLFAVGTILEAKLDVGVTSTRHGVVIAKLTKAVKTLDGQTLVAGTVIKGRSSDDGSKVFLDFQAAMVGQSVVPFGGYAVRTKSKTPGLVAKRTGGSDADSRAKGRVTDTALEVGSDLARAVGGTTGEVLGDLADGATDEARRGNRPSRAVLTLDAGARFRVVVTK